jgi:dethiobiotin synthetase
MSARLPIRGCFVTGTDTAVGKTRVSAALVHALAQAGWRSAGFKPVAAGLSDGNGPRVNEDVRLLRDASSIPLLDADVGPCQLEAACAPHIAAALEGRVIERAHLLRAAHGLTGRADWLVVEGVGGFCVPLAEDWDSADLACDLGLPVVLVVGLRLGCLNHALLTAEAVQVRGLTLAGWVANCIDPAFAHAEENVATLRRVLDQGYGAPCLGTVPRLGSPDAAAVAKYLSISPLYATLVSSRSLQASL